MASQKFLVHADLNGQEIQNVSLEKRAAAPAYAQGIIFEDTTTPVDVGFGSFLRMFYGEAGSFKSVALTDEITALKAYIDNLAIKGIRTQGSINYALATTYPTNPAQAGQIGIGSGTAGAIKQGDSWFVSVAGTFGTKNVMVGDLIIATVDGATSADADRHILQSDLDNATTIKAGITRIATTLEATTGTEAFAYITPATLKTVLDAKVNTVSETFLAQALVANTAKTITLTTAMTNLNAFDVVLKQAGQVVFAQIDAVGTTSFTITSNVAATVDVYVVYKVV
jgi:hypothetical protein